METPKLETTLQGFIKYVIQQSRSNLTKQDKNVSKALYNSLVGDYKVMSRSFEMSFQMEEYGQYLDKGVKGKFSSAKAPNSPFQFGSGRGKKGGLSSGIEKWVAKRRFQFKDRETGKFLSYKQTAALITRSIYMKGTKPTEFFSKPFEMAFKRLPEDIIEAYGIDVENFLKYTISNG